jgi:hypothetical protein
MALIPEGHGEFLGFIPPHELDPQFRQGTFGAFMTEDGVRVLGFMPDEMLRDISPNGKVKRKITKLSGGDKGIKETLDVMKKRAIEGAQHPQIWQLSRLIVGGDNPCPVRDRECEMHRLLGWTQENIRWTPDIGFAETVAAPWRTLEVRAGDCDDLSTLLASLAVSIGIPARFKAIGANKNSPNDFTHVYIEMKDIDGEWVPAEPSVKEAPLGWESPVITRTMQLGVWNGEEL